MSAGETVRRSGTRRFAARKSRHRRIERYVKKRLGSERKVQGSMNAIAVAYGNASLHNVIGKEDVSEGGPEPQLYPERKE